MFPSTTCPSPLDALLPREAIRALRRRVRLIIVCILGLVPAMTTGGVRGDDVITRDVDFPGVRILGLSNGQLAFRRSDGRIESRWLDEIELLQVDRGGVFADLNQAERMLADGRVAQAIPRYRRSLRLTEGFWSEVVPVRLLMAADRAGEIDTATAQFVRVVHGRGAGPRAAVRLFLHNIPGQRTGRVAKALESVTVALSANPDESQIVPLLLMRYQILHRVGADELHQTAERVAALPIPELLRTPAVYERVLSALQTILDRDPRSAAALDGLDRALSDCPAELVPNFLLLKGSVLQRTASTHEEWIRASWPYLRAAIHFPGDPRAAEGYYGAAVALERIGRVDQAMDMLRRAVASATERSRIGGEAGAMLERLQGPQTGSAAPK